MHLLNWILLFTLSLLWGGSFFFAEIALRELSPLIVVWGRVLGAAMMLWLILSLKGIRIPTNSGLWAGFVVMGVLNNVIPFSLIVWGQTEISGSLASVFNATTPLFTIVLAQFLTQDEKISVLKSVGILIGFAGVIVMVGIEVLSGFNTVFLAQVAILLAAISYGLAAIWGRRFKTLDPMISATGQVTCSALIMTPIAFGFSDLPVTLSWEGWLSVGGLAFFCTVLAYILYFKILAGSGATNLMLVTMLIPMSAIVLGNLFLEERLELHQLAGMCLILLGLIVIDGRMLRNNYLKSIG